MNATFSEACGRALRRVRLERGLTLRDVGEISGGRFTPTAVAGYERGERGISAQRFVELAAFYGVRASTLLAEVEEADGPAAPSVIVLSPLEEPSTP
jgi:transcriptional regulator with XRE-family HTH domain